MYICTQDKVRRVVEQEGIKQKKEQKDDKTYLLGAKNGISDITLSVSSSAMVITAGGALDTDFLGLQKGDGDGNEEEESAERLMQENLSSVDVDGEGSTNGLVV